MLQDRLDNIDGRYDVDEVKKFSKIYKKIQIIIIKIELNKALELLKKMEINI